MSDLEIGLVGYLDPWSASPGETVRLHVRDHRERACRVDLVRLVADGAPPAGRVRSEPVPGFEPLAFQGRDRPIEPGSYAQVAPCAFLDALRSFRVEVAVAPTTAGTRPQALLGTWCEATSTGFGLFLDARGVPTVRVGGASGSASCATGVPLRNRAWSVLRASYDAESGRLALEQRPVATHSPGFDLLRAPAAAQTDAAPGLLDATGRGLLFGAWHDGPGRGGHFDGRLEAPRLAARADAERFDAVWDFAPEPHTDRVADTGGLELHGRLVNCPARAVTGSRWDASEHDWRRAPEQWAAIHFHADDLADCGWPADVEVALPAELDSGIHALRVSPDDGAEPALLPLFVRPRPGDESPVLFLVPTATYIAYGNHRLHNALGGPMFGGGELPFQRYLAEHPELGPDMYGFHSDGSGCMYATRRRPLLNVSPAADGWAFSADLALTGFLEHAGIHADVATDEDLHAEGRALLDRHRVVVTGSHPEYWSTAMLDALEAWQREGGRLMYLGGNGFYWRVAFSDHYPGVMELRRVGPATRAWPAEPGEGHHAFSGELGGLWRNIGRPPNAIAGVGFAAQGPGGAPYRRRDASRDPRASWIFAGVKSEDAIGAHGRLRAAADEEIDRFDPLLGSPPHALVLAASEGHGPAMLRVIEEFLITLPPLPDPGVRADLVFYETPGGGAVFSTGSIGWIAALAHEDYQNDLARITANVLRRFADAEPFASPEGAPEAVPLAPWFVFPAPGSLRAWEVSDDD
ncbi:MAG: large subunit of N,N-dimethylformamidase [Myxococcota bacterium]|nr:large subunit of N,N-dimethylformamidase [Myxococcota bacterium]